MCGRGNGEKSFNRIVDMRFLVRADFMSIIHLLPIIYISLRNGTATLHMDRKRLGRAASHEVPVILRLC